MAKARELSATTKWERGKAAFLCLDDAIYPEIDTQRVPTGYASVPVKVCFNALEPGLECGMMAGSVGIEVTDTKVDKVRVRTEQLRSRSRERYRWKSFTLGLMKLCQFGALRPFSPQEPTMLDPRKKQQPITTVEKQEQAKEKLQAAKRMQIDESTTGISKDEIEKNAVPLVVHNAPIKRSLVKPEEADTLSPISKDSIHISSHSLTHCLKLTRTILIKAVLN